MNRLLRHSLVMLVLSGVVLAADQPPPRIPWTTSRVEGTPDPLPPYGVARAFSNLKFTDPSEIVHVPGYDRFAVAECPGKIFVFRNDPAVEKAELLIDLKRQVLGLAFHPNFATNGYLYVVNELSFGVRRVSRLTVDRSTPWRCRPASECAIIRWSTEGGPSHSGGALRFGPDGFLYVATGDGSPEADRKLTGQDVSDLLGSVLRIDVDRPRKLRHYRVPGDNPFVNVAGARPEVWAYGLRQPWKMSFDRGTGDLWVGDVGQDRWESVYRVERGGNYGWSINEGSHPFYPDRPRGPTPIQGPTIEHPHSEFRAVIGGYVYRGKQFPELAGTYVYGDHVTGRIWGARMEGGKATSNRELAATRLRIVGFSEDADGELYVLDFLGGTVHRLIRETQAPQATSTFPRKLSETGLFASVKDHLPAPGVVAYQVNAALWSDGAVKDRFLALPNDGRIRMDGAGNDWPLVQASGGWNFPDGTVLVKTFSLELEPGHPASRRRVETRLLHLTKLADTDEARDLDWRGYTYAWNDDQTDADLVGAGGRDRSYTIRDPRAAGGTRAQTWHFPSRAECITCHSMPAKYVLGVNTVQMNRDVVVNGASRNQLKVLEELGMFASPLPAAPVLLPRLTDYEDEHADLELRARSYLHANCAHCHTLFGGGNSAFQVQANLPLSATGILAHPGHGTLGLRDARIVAPGKPGSSVLYHRIVTTGEGRMPPSSSSVVDENGAKLIAKWIEQLPPEPRRWPLAAGVGGALVILWLAWRTWRKVLGRSSASESRPLPESSR